MPNGDNVEFFRSPREDSGPAVLGREPVVLPEQRKNAVRRVRRFLQDKDIVD